MNLLTVNWKEQYDLLQETNILIVKACEALGLNLKDILSNKMDMKHFEVEVLDLMAEFLAWLLVIRAGNVVHNRLSTEDAEGLRSYQFFAVQHTIKKVFSMSLYNALHVVQMG